MTMSARSALWLALLLLVTAAPAAEARTIRSSHQVIGHVPGRAHEQIGFIPIKGISPGSPPKPVTFRVGKHRYRGIWNNYTFGGTVTTTQLLRQTAREIRMGTWENEVIFADRPLTAAEGRTFKVAGDLYRDADVLLVADGHPACAGITSAQAKDIAARRITRWSQVVTLPAGQPDEINVRVKGDGRAEVHEMRMGLPRKLPAGVRSTIDGGLREIGGGDKSVAAITSWSRVRRGNPGCLVPLDGVAPTDQSVHALRFPEAYPVQMVIPRKRVRSAYTRTIRKAFIAFMMSARAGEMLKKTGVLLARETPPPPTATVPGTTEPGASPAPSGGPTQDYQGRPITPIRDDAAGTNALTGARLQKRDGAGGLRRFGFDAEGVLKRADVSGDGTQCTQVTGQWQVLAAWRYEEHGGGIIARVRRVLDTTDEVTIELPGDAPGMGRINGQEYESDRAAPAGCF